MQKKIIVFLISLMVISINSIIVFAGTNNDPEIIDDEENDVFEYIDIDSAWFYEDEEQPE